jgi:hypothetical protein
MVAARTTCTREQIAFWFLLTDGGYACGPNFETRFPLSFTRAFSLTRAPPPPPCPIARSTRITPLSHPPPSLLPPSFSMPHITSRLQPLLPSVDWMTFIRTPAYGAWRASLEAAAGFDISDMATLCCVGATRDAGCFFTTSRGVKGMSDQKFYEILNAVPSPALMDDGFDLSAEDDVDDGDGDDGDFSSDVQRLRALLTGGFPGAKKRQAVMGALPSIGFMMQLPPGACVPEGVETPALVAVPTVASLLEHLQAANWSAA